MNKKNAHSSIVSGTHGIYRLILFSLFSIAIVFAGPGQVITDIETYFSDLDSALSTFGQEVSRYGAKRAKEPLDKMLRDYPCIEFLIWANSKGAVVNEAVREGKPGKPHRNLSRQKWFEKIKSLEPYYGSLRTRKGDHQLFWCKPIRITKSGRDRFGGAIVVRIDLKRSFDAVAKKIGTPFRVLQKGDTFFSHSWEMSYDSTAVPLTIKGISDIQINAKKEKQVVEAPPPEPVKEKEKASFFSIKTVIVFVSIGIVLIILWSLIKAVIKKRQEALIRRIEGDEPFEPDRPFEKVKEFNEAKEDKLIKDVKTAEAVLPEKKEKDSLKETEVKMPPDKKRKSIFEPEESIAEEESTAEEAAELTEPEESTTKETAEFAKPEELPDAEEKKEVETDQPASREESIVMDFVPPETQVLQPDFADAIKDIKPGQEADEITGATEETEETIPPNIMEKVEALLQKHVHSVLEERVKQIEEDVLARVRDELAGRMKDQEE